MFRSGDTIDPDHVLIFRMIAAEPFVINDRQIAALRDHPAELAVVRVDCGLLPRLPADGHYFEQMIAVDQIASIKFVIEKDVRIERRIRNLHARTEIHHPVSRDQAVIERAQLLYEIINAYKTLACHKRFLKNRYTDFTG